MTLIETSRSKLNHLLPLLRIRPFDCTTPAGRSMERHRRIFFTALSAAIAKVIQVAVMVISVPLALHYLGAERYGVWMTLNSFVAMLAFADLGLGFGLMNAISDAYGSDDAESARTYVSSALAILVIAAALPCVLFAAIYPWINWGHVFSATSSIAAREVGPSLAVFIVCSAIAIPLTAIERVRLGYQEGFHNSIWNSAGVIAGLLGLLIAIRLHAPMPWLIGAMTGGPLLGVLLNGGLLFGKDRPSLRPSLAGVSRDAVRRVFRIGILFLVLQTTTMISYQSDNLVIDKVLGPDQVTTYAVTFRIFLLTPLFLSFALTPLWPAYGEALARGDTAWIRRTLRRSIALGFAVNTLPSLLLIFFGRTLIHWWLGPGVTPSFALLFGMALWATLNAVQAPLAMLFNGLNIVRYQVICETLNALSNLGLSIYLAKRIGMSGVMFGTVAAQLLFVFLPAAFYVPRLLRRLPSIARAGQNESDIADQGALAQNAIVADISQF